MNNIKITPGTQIDRYTVWRNFLGRRERYSQLKVLASPSIDHTNHRIPVYSSSNPAGYTTIKETDLYKDLLERSVYISSKKGNLSDIEDGFIRLWKAYCDGVFDKARKNHTGEGNPILWVTTFHSIPHQIGSTRINNSVELEILPDNRLLPTVPTPELLRVIAVFNEVIST